MQIILEVPDILGEKQHALGDRLPEALVSVALVEDRALQELTHPETPYPDEIQIVELLASQPSPEVILAIRPTPALQNPHERIARSP